MIEVYCRCPMEVLLQRDDQGLFERANRGEVQHMAGVNAPYEEPFKPEVLVNTDVETVDAAVDKIVGTLVLLGYLKATDTARYTADEEEIIKRRLRSALSPFTFAVILWTTMTGYLVFGDVPDAPTIAGAGVIILSGVYVFYRERVVKLG